MFKVRSWNDGSELADFVQDFDDEVEARKQAVENMGNFDLTHIFNKHGISIFRYSKPF